MKNNMPSPLKNVLDVFKSQVAASLIALVVVALISLAALPSFFLGELVMLCGNAFLAWKVYRQGKNMAPLSLLFSFLGGETGKYVLLVLFTIIIAKVFPQLNWLFYAIGIATPQLLGIIFYLIWNRYKKS